jgi:hypothetical protein
MMFRYDFLARQRMHQLLREAEMARLRRVANDARRVTPTRPRAESGNGRGSFRA